MSDVVNGRERIVGFLRDLAASDISRAAKLGVIKYAFVSMVISEAEFRELRDAAKAASVTDPKPRKKRRRFPVKKHVLAFQQFRSAKEMLNSETPLSKRTIGQLIGVSERTIRRVANGEYDSYFKTTAKRNAAASAGVNGQS